MRRLAFACFACLAASPLPASATPGPDSVVVIANAGVPESVALAERYASARDVPANRVCLLELPEVEDLTLEDYGTLFLEPLRACLDAGGVRDRIEAAVLIRGVPLRVSVPVSSGNEVVSLAAALGLWESTLSDGTPMLGQEPGMSASCGDGITCYAARWRNAYRGDAFDPGWSVEASGAMHRPLLVTMLHGRSYADAEHLLDSALEAEASGPGDAELLFMEGADPARGAQDPQNALVIAELTSRGLSASSVPFDANLTGRTLGAFFTGTASLGETIEGNTYLPGSIVDNLTSFGAVPGNFRETGESQVSIARWVAMGVAGVHGTVAEPLNNCFPHRRLILAYVDGATLAEAYHSQMPFVYWRNLVLGDPMAAPYAQRPEVTITGVADGARLGGATRVEVSATDPGERGIESIVLYLDGVEIARAAGGSLEHCLVVPAGDGHQLLAVARALEDPAGVRIYREKGWLALSLDASAGATECAAPMPDAGPPDGGAQLDADVGDAGTVPPSAGGCGCRVRGSRSPGAAPLALLALLASRRRQRAARPLARGPQ